MDKVIVFGNFVLALVLGVGVIWLGWAIFGSWWTLIVTIPLALSIMRGFLRWQVMRKISPGGDWR